MNGASTNEFFSKQQAKLLDMRNYKVPAEMSIPQRVAHCLDWAASNFPKQYVPYNMLLKGVMGYSKMPRLNSEEVEGLRKRTQRIKQILLATYNRKMHVQPGVGLRATVDDADVLQNVLPFEARRLNGARNTVVNTVSMIDVSKVPNTPEMRIYKDWLNRDVKEVVKLIGSASFSQKLLPPTSKPITEK